MLELFQSIGNIVLMVDFWSMSYYRIQRVIYHAFSANPLETCIFFVFSPAIYPFFLYPFCHGLARAWGLFFYTCAYHFFFFWALIFPLARMNKLMYKLIHPVCQGAFE